MAKKVINTSLSEEMKKSIDNYGSQIKTLKDSVTATRKVPGMYIGKIGALGLKNMIREVFQNAIDQMIMVDSPCDHIYVYYNMQTLQVIVEDNGRGIPFTEMVRVLTVPHTSKNYEKKKFEYSSGRHGVTIAQYIQ